MAVPGEFLWPFPGTSRGRPRGIFMTACGEFLMAIDTGSTPPGGDPPRAVPTWEPGRWHQAGAALLEACRDAGTCRRRRVGDGGPPRGRGRAACCSRSAARARPGTSTVGSNASSSVGCGRRTHRRRPPHSSGRRCSRAGRSLGSRSVPRPSTTGSSPGFWALLAQGRHGAPRPLRSAGGFDRRGGGGRRR